MYRSKYMLRMNINHYRGLLQLDGSPNMSPITCKTVQDLLDEAEEKLAEIEAEEAEEMKQAG